MNPQSPTKTLLFGSRAAPGPRQTVVPLSCRPQRSSLNTRQPGLMDILRPEPVPYDPKRAAVTRVVLLLDVGEHDPLEARMCEEQPHQVSRAKSTASDVPSEDCS